jgi:hypothetical protein
VYGVAYYLHVFHGRIAVVYIYLGEYITVGFQRTVLASFIIAGIVVIIAAGGWMYEGRKAVGIRDRSIAASAGVSSYFYTMAVSTRTEGFIGNSTVNISSSTVGNVSIDIDRRLMYSPVSIHVRGSSEGEPISIESTVEMYVLNNTLYTLSEGMWAKQALEEDAWGNTQLEQEEKVVEGADVRLAGVETVRGEEAYVLEFRPDVNAIMEYSVDVAGDMPSLEDEDRIEDYGIKEWVSTESLLPQKSVTEFTMVSGDVKTLMKITVEYYDYNKPLILDLPVGAAEAEDIAQTALFTP